MEKCLVCGMEVEISESAESTIYKNKTYYFCTTLCKVMFLQEPDKYLNGIHAKKNSKR